MKLKGIEKLDLTEEEKEALKRLADLKLKHKNIKVSIDDDVTKNALSKQKIQNFLKKRMLLLNKQEGLEEIKNGER